MLVTQILEIYADLNNYFLEKILYLCPRIFNHKTNIKNKKINNRELLKTHQFSKNVSYYFAIQIIIIIFA
jgi:uncharacterized membrane protein